MTQQATNHYRLVTPEMLHELPEPVQRYMAYTGVVGKPWIDTVRITYQGRFRMAADKPWMPIRAEQVYTTNPPAFHIAWQAVDDRSADVTFADAGKRVTARLFFDDAGRLTDFVALRYRENKGAFALDTWSTPMTQYGVLGGLNLPVRGQAVWKLPSGDLPYADLMLDSIDYNAPIPSI